MRLYVADRYSRWGRRLAEAARGRGWRARLISDSRDIDGPGYGFIRLHPAAGKLEADRKLAQDMRRRGLAMIQDEGQVAVYEDKCRQARQWGGWMPRTEVFEDMGLALDRAIEMGLPLISKAAEGASSYNVRLIEDRRNLEAHIRQAFGGGIPIRGYTRKPEVQRGYVLLQTFVPHDVTYRVNAVGRQRAVFFRRCYPDRPMAQTGNVEPAFSRDDVPEGLLEFADSFFQEAATRWCALDILHDKEAAAWRLLETSLAWPHPSPGRCNDGRFWLSGKRWEEMWDVLLDEIEAGVFGP